MVAGGQFWHHAAIFGMQGGLGVQRVSEEAACAVVERDTSFVAGGFNTED
jgi:hypothetical protein